MKLANKTLLQLREYINEKPDYRSGPVIVDFFNQLGFSDSYGQGFPSRWYFTDQKLSMINNSDKIKECIQNLFDPINFIGRYEILDEIIGEFNEYLYYDNYRIEVNNKKLFILELDKDNLITNFENKETAFLDKKFPQINLDSIDINTNIKSLLELRVIELNRSIQNQASLSTIFLCGSILEGLLYAFGEIYKKEYYSAQSSIKNKEGNPINIVDWKLSDLIDTSYEVGVIRHDVKKFSHVLRDFRNFIHPVHQLKSNFNTDMYTTQISVQVLYAAFAQATEYQINYK